MVNGYAAISGVAARQAGQQGRFTGVRLAQQSHVRDQLEFQHHVAVFAFAAGFGLAGGAVDGGGELFVALAAVAAAGDHHLVAVGAEVAERVTAFRIFDEGAGGNLDQDVVGGRAGLELAAAMFAAAGVPELMTDEMNQAADVLVSPHDDAAAPAAVAAVGAAAGHEFLPAERHAAVPPVAGFAM